MIPISVKRVVHPPPAEKIVKNIEFGTAVGLTETAKQGQKASLSALKGTFTLRGSWFEQQNKFGIKVKSATKIDQTAEIRSMADWIEPHEKGGTKRPRSGSNLAIPTDNVRRNKRQIIPRAQRPKNLKNTFVMNTKTGRVLFQRFSRKVGMYNGKPTRLKALYALEPRARIRKQSTFNEPIERVVRRNGADNIRKGVARAFATMR